MAAVNNGEAGRAYNRSDFVSIANATANDGHAGGQVCSRAGSEHYSRTVVNTTGQTRAGSSSTKGRARSANRAAGDAKKTAVNLGATRVGVGSGENPGSAVRLVDLERAAVVSKNRGDRVGILAGTTENQNLGSRAVVDDAGEVEGTTAAGINRVVADVGCENGVVQVDAAGGGFTRAVVDQVGNRRAVAHVETTSAVAEGAGGTAAADGIHRKAGAVQNGVARVGVGTGDVEERPVGRDNKAAAGTSADDTRQRVIVEGRVSVVRARDVAGGTIQIDGVQDGGVCESTGRTQLEGARGKGGGAKDQRSRVAQAADGHHERGGGGSEATCGRSREPLHLTGAGAERAGEGAVHFKHTTSQDEVGIWREALNAAKGQRACI